MVLLSLNLLLAEIERSCSGRSCSKRSCSKRSYPRPNGSRRSFSLNDALDDALEEAACFPMASTLDEIAFRFGVTGGSYNLFLILISTFSGRMPAVIH